MGKKLRLLLIASGCFLFLGFAILMFTSMSYDKSNPRNRPNSYFSELSVEINKPIEYVYNFIKYEIPNIYTETSSMHEQFNIINADGLTEGAEVECIEGDNEDVVHHRYIVKKDIENVLIQMESEPSIIHDKETNKQIGKCNCYCYFDFVALDNNRTMVKQTVVTDMLNPFYKLIVDVMGLMSGGKDLWNDHFQEELENLKLHIEK